MKTFQIKQKMWSLGGKFLINDESGLPTYQVEGSFLQIPKSFTIMDMSGRVVGQIDHQIFTLLPKFTVTLASGQSFSIKKDFSFFRPHYSIENLNMQVQGDFWDMEFELTQDNEVIARISQEWFRMTSTYQVSVFDERFSDLVISLVVAIDYVKEQDTN